MEFDHILSLGRFLNVAARRLSFTRRICLSVCLLVFYVFQHAIVHFYSVPRPSLLFSKCNVIVHNFVSCELCVCLAVDILNLPSFVTPYHVFHYLYKCGFKHWQLEIFSQAYFIFHFVFLFLLQSIN